MPHNPDAHAPSVEWRSTLIREVDWGNPRDANAICILGDKDMTLGELADKPEFFIRTAPGIGPARREIIVSILSQAMRGLNVRVPMIERTIGDLAREWSHD